MFRKVLSIGMIVAGVGLILWGPFHCVRSVRSPVHADTATARDIVRGRKVTVCNPDLWDHIYRPARLARLRDCITVEGTARSIRREPDGDLTFKLDVDAGFLKEYPNLLNRRNKGFLMIEVICAQEPVAAHAKAGCRGWVNPDAPVLHEGDRVRVLGPLVLDTFHRHNEIHPAEVRVSEHRGHSAQSPVVETDEPDDEEEEENAR